MVVKLTQEQADYLKTFGNFEHAWNKKKAIYYIARYGWGYEIKDGDEKEKEVFYSTEQLKMIEAVINGYEVIEPKFKFYKYFESRYNPLYYAGAFRQLTNNEEEALEVKKDSNEYIALKCLGFYFDEV